MAGFTSNNNISNINNRTNRTNRRRQVVGFPHQRAGDSTTGKNNRKRMTGV
jgi:hypothetical protein